MKRRTLSIDIDALAAELLNLIQTMPDPYTEALALGMLPAPLMDKLSGMMREKIDRELAEEATFLRPDDEREQLSRDWTWRVSVRMIGLAAERGLCVV